MKKRIYIILLLLIVLMPVRGQQYTLPAATNDWQNAQPAQIYTTTTTMAFRSTAMQMGNYNIVFAAQDLSAVAVGVRHAPPVIDKDDTAPDTPALPVGDGTWVLLALSAFYALFVFVRRRKQART